MDITRHPLFKAIYDLCLEIETLPAAEHQTKLVTMASNLKKPAEMLYEKAYGNHPEARKPDRIDQYLRDMHERIEVYGDCWVETAFARQLLKELNEANAKITLLTSKA